MTTDGKLYNILQYGIVWCRIVYSIVQFSVVQCSAVQYMNPPLKPQELCSGESVRVNIKTV